MARDSASSATRTTIASSSSSASRRVGGERVGGVEWTLDERLVGRFALAGDELLFGTLATTRTACSETVMARERDFLAALALVTAHELDKRSLALLAGRGDRRPADVQIRDQFARFPHGGTLRRLWNRARNAS